MHLRLNAPCAAESTSRAWHVCLARNGVSTKSGKATRQQKQATQDHDNCWALPMDGGTNAGSELRRSLFCGRDASVFFRFVSAQKDIQTAQFEMFGCRLNTVFR